MRAGDDLPELADWQAAIHAFLARFASAQRAGWRCQPSPPATLAPWDDPRRTDGRTLLSAGGGTVERAGYTSQFGFSVIVDWAGGRVVLDEVDEKGGTGALDDGETIRLDGAWLRAFKRVPWPVDQRRHYGIWLGLYAESILGRSRD